MTDSCSVEGCDRPVRVAKRGLCARHYERWRRLGDPTLGRTNQTLGETCSVEGCETRPVSLGLCSKHYSRLRRHGHLDPPEAPRERCSVEGCDRPHEARGLCGMHYSRFKRTGSTELIWYPATCGCDHVSLAPARPCPRCRKRAHSREYRKTDAARRAKQRWRESPAGRESRRRCKARARRLGKSWATDRGRRRSDR